MKKIPLILFVLVVLSMSRCGPPGSDTTSSCTPNVIDSGMSMQVSQLGTNVYQFQLCSNSVPLNATYSVYGGVDSASISQNNFNVQAAVRSTHISQANSTGATFQVTFLPSDNYFAIYQDQAMTNSFILNGSSTPLVAPHPLPGR